MINQQVIRKKIELEKPAWAVETGSASIPPPIEVPTINSIPPINLDFCTILHLSALN
jgi:hypothetical protein